jgi:hypothetical protein
MMHIDEYYQKQYASMLRRFKPKHKPFGKSMDLAAWFMQKLRDQDCRCYYCETSIFIIQELIAAHLLETRKTKGTGERGPVLEIEKDGAVYDPKSSVLAENFLCRQ